MSKKKVTKRLSLGWLHRFQAGIFLLTFMVMTISGFTNNISPLTISFRSFLVFGVIWCICRVLTSIFISYEELQAAGKDSR